MLWGVQEFDSDWELIPGTFLEAEGEVKVEEKGARNAYEDTSISVWKGFSSVEERWQIKVLNILRGLGGLIVL